MASTAFSSGLWFLFIIAAIPVALWLFKRSPAGARYGSSATGLGGMRQIASLPLSPHQRIVTVEVGQGDARRWLVLGVTAQQISPLHTLLPAEDTAGTAPGATAPAPGFGQLLGRLRQNRDGS